MTKKLGIQIFAVLALLPAAASAQELPSMTQVLAGLKASRAHVLAAPAPHAVAAKVSAISAPAPALDIEAMAQAAQEVSVVGGHPQGALSWKVKNGRLGAVFTDSQGDSIPFTFSPDVSVENGRILYRGSVTLGTVVSGRPVLAPGYSLDYYYGGTIDAGTGADTAFVHVHITAPALAGAPDKIYGTGNVPMVSMVGGEPKGAQVGLVLLKNGRVGAIYQDAEGDSLAFTFYPELTVFNGEIFYKNIYRVGRAYAGMAVLGPGYELDYSYGGTIDAGTGADRAFVDVFIAAAQ
ncbi:MAG TPA: hypothetical protein VNK24_10390 [Elusimicrobiota bacterium]|nr:hypothetical protein [Elusimicrobiota bacterium]